MPGLYLHCTSQLGVVIGTVWVGRLGTDVINEYIKNTVQ